MIEANQSKASPALNTPPSFQTVAEKQREPEAAANLPEAGLREFVDYPNHGHQANPQDIEANLQGEMVKAVLTKHPHGLGFTIIGGDHPGELLQIRNIVPGGVADRDGRLKVGDVLVRVNGELVVTYSHHKAVELFQSIPLHSEVELEMRHASSRIAPDTSGMLASEFADGERFSSEPELVLVSITKGPLGFGFSLSEYQNICACTCICVCDLYM